MKKYSIHLITLLITLSTLFLVWTPGVSMTEDLGRHLLLGKIILENVSVPSTNYLSYTFPNFPFVNHHWLSELVFHLLHRQFAFNGLILCKTLLMALTIFVACRAVPWKKSYSENNFHLLIFYIAGILAAIIFSFRAHVRPELFTYFFIAALLWIFERIRQNHANAIIYRLLISFIILLWVNFHIYFIFGIGMLGAFMIEELLTFWNLKKIKTNLAWLAITLTLCLINPNGLQGFLYPLNIFSNYGVSVTENLSPLALWASILNPMLLALPVFSLILIACLVVESSRFRNLFRNSRSKSARLGAYCHELRLANIIIAITALIATWLMARSAPLLVICAMPLIIASGRHKKTFSLLKFQKIAGLAIAATLILNFYLLYEVVSGAYSRIFPSPIAPTAFGFDIEERYQSLRNLKKKFGIKGPVFSDYNIGSLVEYELYPEPGYVDNRPEAFPESFWKNEYDHAFQLGEKWREICKLRDFNLVIVSLWGVNEGFFAQMGQDPNWALIHIDEFCAVWIRNRIENREIIKELGFNDLRASMFARKVSAEILRLPDQAFWLRPVLTERILFRLYALYLTGHGNLAWPYLKQLHLMYPDYQAVHELLRVTAPIEEIVFIEEIMQKQARWPLSAKQVLDWGKHLERKGKLKEGKKVFRRGKFFFPLSKIF